MGTQAQPEGEAVAANAGADNAAENRHEEVNAEAGQEGGEGAENGGENAAAEGQEQTEEKAKLKKPLSWEMKRIHEETNKRREAERRAQELEAELSRVRGGNGASQEQAEAGEQPSIDDIRRQTRDEIRREETQRQEAERRNAACNNVFEKGVAEIDDFVDARDTLVTAFGHEINARPEFLDAITDIDNGHQVFAELGRNPDEAERILSLSPVKMAMEIAKLGTKLSKPNTPAPKPVSKVPPPVNPLGGKPTEPNVLDDPDADQDKWSKEFLKRFSERQR
ncbi:hypothetical protein DXM27_05145 [Rhizobium rhizogenes]|uniref:Scaffolding protein n=2 Tax=Rhizobium rhizogenes TaxID=359 RepID=A0AA88F4L9_RHIRH|nr:hypothetical protein DXM27_05145 [Rhizobium rhizogenes]